MGNIRVLIEKYRGILVYLFFGALTTGVNYAVYLHCYNLLGMSAATGNLLAWSAAVIFAYVTNKIFVFSSRSWSVRVVIPELTRFLGGRALSGGLETVALYVTVDRLQWNGNVMKFAAAVFVIVANYLFGKFLVFGR